MLRGSNAHTMAEYYGDQWFARKCKLRGWDNGWDGDGRRQVPDPEARAASNTRALAVAGEDDRRKDTGRAERGWSREEETSEGLVQCSGWCCPDIAGMTSAPMHQIPSVHVHPPNRRSMPAAYIDSRTTRLGKSSPRAIEVTEYCCGTTL